MISNYIINDIYSRHQRHDINWNALIPVFNEIGELPELYRGIIAMSYRLVVKDMENLHKLGGLLQ